MLYQMMLASLMSIVKSLVVREIEKLGDKKLAIAHVIDDNFADKREEALLKAADKFTNVKVSADKALVLAKTLHKDQIVRAGELDRQRRSTIVTQRNMKVEKAINKEVKISVAISNLEKSLVV